MAGLETITESDIYVAEGSLLLPKKSAPEIDSPVMNKEASARKSSMHMQRAL